MGIDKIQISSISTSLVNNKVQDLKGYIPSLAPAGIKIPRISEFSKTQVGKKTIPLLAESGSVILGVIVIYLFLYYFARGGPLSSDVTGYMNDSLNGTSNTFILNRYFNVFIQSIFLKSASTPLLGLQAYWSFLISMTCGLIYLSARLFSPRSGVFHGLFALLLFFSIKDIASTAGMPLVDISAMLMALLLVLIFILSARRNHQSSTLILLLGVLFYMALRTKETTLPVAILFFGLGMVKDKPFNWKTLFTKLRYVLLGMVCGMLLFVLMNAMFLHNPLFGFRLTDIQTFLSTYVTNLVGGAKPVSYDNWFNTYFFNTLLVPFVLYLVSALKTSRDQEFPGSRLVWLIPLGLIIFPTITVGNQWGLNPRFVFPALPVICLLAPQSFDYDLRSIVDSRARKNAKLVVALGLIMIPIITLALRIIPPRIGWDVGSYKSVVYVPILIAIVLVLAFYFNKLSVVPSYIITGIVIASIISPIAGNIKLLIRDQPNRVASQKMFYPLSAFAHDIHFAPDMQMYISSKVWEAVGMGQFAKDRNEISALFNIYFDAGSNKGNFRLANTSTSVPADLLDSDYTYGLLSADEWTNIIRDDGIAYKLEQEYNVIQDSNHIVVLLEHK